MKSSFVAYLLARAKEASTWRGLMLIATSAGIVIAPQLQEAVVTGGLLAAGLIGAAVPDAKKDK